MNKLGTLIGQKVKVHYLQQRRKNEIMDTIADITKATGLGTKVLFRRRLKEYNSAYQSLRQVNQREGKTRHMKIINFVASSLNYLQFPNAYGLIRRKINHSQVFILAYHHVTPDRNHFFNQVVEPQEFERQIRYLHKTSEIMPLDELAYCIFRKKPLPEKAAVITLDDGYKDNYIYAYPILKKYDAPATVFLTTGYIGGGKLFPWDEVNYILRYTTRTSIEIDELGKYVLHTMSGRQQVAHKIWQKLTNLPQEKRKPLIKRLSDLSGVEIPDNLGKEHLLSWDEIGEMSRGGIAFGAHTVNHPILAKLPLEQAKNEIIQSKKDIEERLDKPVTAFCYPNGNFNPNLVEVLIESGFTCALSSNMGLITSEARPYMLQRLPAGGNLDTLKISSSGLYTDLLGLVSRNKREKGNSKDGF